MSIRIDLTAEQLIEVIFLASNQTLRSYEAQSALYQLADEADSRYGTSLFVYNVQSTWLTTNCSNCGDEVAVSDPVNTTTLMCATCRDIHE